MQVFPYALKGLIREEIAYINQQKNSCDAISTEPDLVDPTDEIIRVLSMFLEWYLLLRRPVLDSDELQDAAEKTLLLQKTLKTTFPGKSWKFIKFHVLRHICFRIAMYGWWENVSCQSGEHCHQFFLKVLKHLTNNKVDFPLQIFTIHKRRAALVEIIKTFGGSELLFFLLVILLVFLIQKSHCR